MKFCKQLPLKNLKPKSQYFSSKKLWLHWGKQSCLLVFVNIIVPTQLVGGEELFNQMGFFVQSILADWYIHRREKLVQQRVRNYNEFLISFFFEELSRFRVSCEHVMFGMILLPFRVFFVQIQIFSLKKLIQNCFLCYK